MIVFKAHSKAIYDLAFSPDGQQLLTYGGDETVLLWSLAKMEQVGRWPGSKYCGAVAMSPNGRFIACGGHDVRLWPIDDIKPLVDSHQYNGCVAFAPNGKELVAHGESSLTRWALPSAKLLPGGWGGTRESNKGNQFPTGPAAYHPDGTLLAACFGIRGTRGFDSAILLFAVKTGKLRGTLRTEFASQHATAIRFSRDGSLLAGLYGPTLRVWDVRAEREVAARQVGKKHFKGLAFSADGRSLLTTSNDESVQLWDTATWTEKSVFEWTIGKLGAVAVDHLGGRMAAGSSTGKIIIWDVDR